MYADGCVRGNVIFLSSKDKDWHEQFIKSLQYNGPIYEEYHKKFDKHIYKTRICDKKLAEDLKKHGCVERKSLILQFPELPENLVHHFIRGYFDGDGTVGRRNNDKRNPESKLIRSGICSGSKDFLEKILSFLPTNHKKIDKKNNRELYEFRFSPNDSMKFYDYLYKDATVYLQRKYQIFQEELQRRSETIMVHLQKTSREYKNAQAKAWYEKCKLENPEKWEQLRLRHNAREAERRKKLKKMKE